MKLRSCAKINLSLDILHRREDGYHELASIVHTVGLWDEIALEWTSGSIEFSCSRAELEGENNLCVRALQEWREAAHVEVGAKISLQKTIPSGAGLGGGSGNAAAILWALQHRFEHPLEPSALNRVAAKLGADVPLFLSGGALLMEGIGERVTPLPGLSGWVLLVKPETSLDTGAVYRAWSEGQFTSRNSTPSLLETWNNELEVLARHCGNDLERAAARVSAVPKHCLELLHAVGAPNARMSGSGSACYALWNTEAEAHEAAQRFGALMAKEVRLLKSRLFVVPLCDCGIECVEQ